MPFRIYTNIGTFVLFLLLCSLPVTPLLAADFPDGFLEQPGANPARATLTQAQIQRLLPNRGSFTFPSPYNTKAARLTNASDCNGSDCVNSVGYAYWRNINNHVNEDTMLIFVTLDKNRGGAGPSLLAYDKLTDEVSSLGPIFDADDALSWATGEGWYFSASRPAALYITSGSRLRRYDVLTREFETVFDVTTELGNGYYIWQVHSSNDDRVHSATLRDKNTYAMLGCMFYREDTKQLEYFPKQGVFDECQIDKSGDWLLIKEDIDGRDGEDNRIINVNTLQERILLDRDGAAGHSDMGYGYMIAADNFANNANSQKLWRFDAGVLRGEEVYHNSDWSVFSPAHVSHANAAPGTAPEAQIACGSSANRNNSPQANEIICFTLDGSNESLVIAPVMTNLNATGGGDDYSKMPKGNLDISGKYFIWTSNMGGARQDVFVVKVPDRLISASDTIEPDPRPNPDPKPDPKPNPKPTPADALIWADAFNAVVTGTTVTKNRGCDGCPDAGAVSRQELSSGDGYLEFTVTETRKLRYTGLSAKQAHPKAGKIDFALALQAGYAEVRENGLYRADIPVKAGDVLRISVDGGNVDYARNGELFYTSHTAPAFPLRAYAILFSSGGSISDAVFTGTSTIDIPPVPAPPTPPTLGDGFDSFQRQALNWSDLVHSFAQGGSLTKKGGCDGCPDATATSHQEIIGDGYLEFTASDTWKLRYAGLAENRAGTNIDQLGFALALQAGYVEVRENGIYRADSAINDGDLLRISVQDGKVTYARNGRVFYASTNVASNPLRAHAVLFSAGSNIHNAHIASN